MLRTTSRRRELVGQIKEASVSTHQIKVPLGTPDCYGLDAALHSPRRLSPIHYSDQLQALRDEEDLIHKAAGWMLREVGKKAKAILEAFLDQHGTVMPRTMLRYAIEHFSPDQRRAYLQEKANVE